MNLGDTLNSGSGGCILHLFTSCASDVCGAQFQRKYDDRSDDFCFAIDSAMTNFEIEIS
jgi:hypothetical protein